MKKGLQLVFSSPATYAAIVFLAWSVSGTFRHEYGPHDTPPTTATIYPPSFSVTLGKNDLDFGRGQLALLIGDRTEMNKYVAPQDEIYQWAIRQFGGEAMGEHIFWDPSLPEGNPECLAVNSPPTLREVGLIKIRKYYETGKRKGQRLNGEQLWNCLVFESYNISHRNEFMENDSDVMMNRISEKEWMIETARIEFKALLKTKRFYQYAWKPLMDSKGIKTNPHIWYMDEPDTFEAWFAQFGDFYEHHDQYPYNFYKPLFDRYIAPHQWN